MRWRRRKPEPAAPSLGVAQPWSRDSDAFADLLLANVEDLLRSHPIGEELTLLLSSGECRLTVEPALAQPGRFDLWIVPWRALGKTVQRIPVHKRWLLGSVGGREALAEIEAEIA